MWENEGNKSWEHIGRGRERGTGWGRDRLLTLDLTLWRAAMPCCSKELSSLSLSLCLFPSSSPSAHVRLSKDAEKQTWSYRRPAEQSQSHHLHLSKHSGERGRQKREGEKVRGGGGETNSLHDTGWVFRLEYTVCKTVGWVGMWRDGEICAQAHATDKNSGKKTGN